LGNEARSLNIHWSCGILPATLDEIELLALIEFGDAH